MAVEILSIENLDIFCDNSILPGAHGTVIIQTDYANENLQDH